MSYMFSHLANEASSTGYSTVVYKEGNTVEIDSILNEDLTVNELESEKLVLEMYTRSFNNAIVRQKSVYDESAGSETVDTVYMGGGITRRDYSIGSEQGQAVLARMTETWPEEMPTYTEGVQYLVGEYSPSRPPYENETLSFYDFNGPTESIKATFGGQYEEYKTWYGLKFDAETQEVFCKFVIPMLEMARVDYTTYSAIMSKIPPAASHFFALIHDKSGNVDENVDIYFQAEPDIMEDWCESNSLEFPYDKINTAVVPRLFCWGCVYNKTSESITHVKAYTRHLI